MCILNSYHVYLLLAHFSSQLWIKYTFLVLRGEIGNQTETDEQIL